jgi:hypothetical protein
MSNLLYVPEEHDVLNDNGEMFRERFGRQGIGDGWYSFDKKGARQAQLGDCRFDARLIARV